MTEARDDGAEVKRLKLNLRTGRKGAEWLDVECGGRRCRLRVTGAHGGQAQVEIDAPLAFAFARETAVDRRDMGVSR